ncbi:MAG TPA: ChaN family lipoprotein, partial [Polyangiales bacterium]
GFVALSVLSDALARSDLVVLGETHDNRDHHQLEAKLMALFADAHGKVSVGFEMLDAKQGDALARIPARSADELARRVDWQHSGWPDFAIYRVLFERVFEKGATIIAASPDPKMVRASMSGLDAAEARALHLDLPLPPAQAAAQYAEIRASHCGQAPDEMIAPMQRAQSFKDAFMARAVLSAQGPALLVAGRGHARIDRGVPLFWQRAGLPSLSIAFVEVEDDVRRLSAYDVAAFDFVVFTPRVSDEDPCARFRRELERMRAGHAD